MNVTRCDICHQEGPDHERGVWILLLAASTDGFFKRQIGDVCPRCFEHVKREMNKLGCEALANVIKLRRKAY